MSDIQKNATPGRPKGCLNYPPEFKQRLVAESCKPGGSISRLALDNGINTSLLFKWHQLWRQGKLQLPSGAITSDPLLIPVTIEPETAPVTEAACMAHTRRKIHDVHVRRQIRNPRQPGRRATDRQKSQKRSVDAVAVRLDTTADVYVVAPLGYSEGVHLSAEAMGCPERILLQWLGGDRQ